MKELCNKLMTLASYNFEDTDYTILAFIYFILDNSLYLTGCFTNDEFSQYIYRFYADNPILRKTNKYILIKNIYHYSPKDLEGYTSNFLKYIEEKSNIIKILSNKVVFLCTVLEEDLNLNMINMVVNMLSNKILPNSNFHYTEKLDDVDFIEYKNSFKLFNRMIEKTNYCFICETYDIQNLTVIRLQEGFDKKTLYDINNYYIVCKEHENLFVNKRLIIRKNGYAYLDGKRLFGHIDISNLRKIRDYLV